MAIAIETKKGFKTYITIDGHPPTRQDIKRADRYERQLKQKMMQVTTKLEMRGFFREANDLKKWYDLGRQLQFLKEMPMRKRCDPTFTYTWQILYNIAPQLTPTGRGPKTQEYVTGRKNHFYLCYLLAQTPWKQVYQLNWSTWTEIYLALTPEVRQDRRVVEWIIQKIIVDGKPNRQRLRRTLKAVRKIAGQKSKPLKDTTVFTDKELIILLETTLEHTA